MSNRLPILPGTPAQRVNEQILPYIPGTAPVLPEDQITRANQISVNIEDDIKPFSLGLQDIDEAVFYYFNNVIFCIVSSSSPLCILLVISFLFLNSNFLSDPDKPS